MTNIEDIKSIDFRKVASRVVIPRDIFDMPREKGKSDIKPWLTHEAFEPYIDEDIQGDDVSVPGQVQKITDQKKLPVQDTSRGARSE
ncbi:MAG: hypothetical protein IJY92_05310 [Alphaproteobacteria bacterium]|nr:hypothetical protein [Alphaproteobacteria bacterium]